MGLDITVHRLLSEPKDKNNYFRLTDENGNYKESRFPEWTKPLEREVTEDWYDWDLYKEKTGIDIDTLEIGMISYGEKSIMTAYPKDMKLFERSSENYDQYRAELKKNEIVIDLSTVPLKKVTVKVVYYEEVGYQRKGLNPNFYSDYENDKIGYFVWSKEELERYKREYCDEQSDYYDHPKEAFQKNIIDKFQEGTDCVTFDW